MEVVQNTKEAFRESLYVRALKQSQTSFFSYVKFVAPTLVDDFKVGAHIKVISDKLQEIVTGLLA